MRIVVLGASGQLGSCLKKNSTERNITDISFPSEENANILNKELLDKLLTTEKPQFVINCAAYTAVDKAEDDVDTCRKVNRDGAAYIAEVCKKHQATLIHISTDFVFKGDIPKLLSETDPAEPENIYGLTKLEGEAAISEILPEHFTIRTSWLYSEFGNNFVKTMLRLGREREQLGVIIDQVGSPTYAIDLANVILDITESGSTSYGIYHYSNEGVTSWYDFAKAVFDLSETTVKLNPVKTSEYVTRAVRPAYSVMDKSKIKATFDITIPYWRDSLSTCVERLLAEVS
ncbi:dTDP-4-dehydrorhamnose reductase [Dyadobacter sp. BE34]|uniref:dTDP-4-dehydrorhamnose reductase n=1 Tax=Dyadobacter fermentans TaxID=94254 RepID=A0ABU1R9D4_9BACT|nr:MULTISPECIES: dTDP-4-dehydrorhamnose reductase [Dyadobacter]MDR6809215.1 dTDP-4-dehydrorhamnose reductase [Dyadobacter fermentans]MDR7046958.1 dTDP-4-dehydrorhamnose reductase [Dyadobacter sp. BE242]MDR7201272.1 dTDP-4-dehydrorhamnose reductase [Dyadobacter sp. BE34]MDR7219232.1 dTDP-4-dehydrorhamnose reductase [Dyadobacter sp. BE31]MDR7264558.1 dTDP-4-dehydrorhamnose reductase [Dyadobacter sp. BE32]